MRNLILAFFSAALLAPAQQPLDSSDLTAFLDGLVPMQLEREDVAGAVICIVKDGKVIFEKGYGYADVEKKSPVSPTQTLFRPGSISKLFNWTAVMQLVEQGKLDLERNVNGYIDFEIPPSFGQPITLRHIMTHTPGFEETGKELFVGDVKDMQSLRAYLTAHMPRRIYPPGTTPAYSNYATALAGYIVQRASGQPFDKYMEENILKPLRMGHTTFVQPVPEAWKPLLSAGYRRASGKANPFEFVNAFPAGSVSTTGDDMTRFMIAHLQDGEFEGRRILTAATAQKMHARAFGLHPDMNGMALGFYEETRNGHRIIGHGGDTVYFHSDLHLVPDAGLGFFVSYNSTGKGEISPRTALWQKFFDRYYPALPAAIAEQPPAATTNLAEVTGYYVPSRRFETNLLAITSLVEQAEVKANSDGTISTPSKGFNGVPKRYREVAPLVFRDVNSQDKIAFRKTADGQTELVVGFPAMVLQKVPWHRNQMLHFVIIGCSLAVIALNLLAWPAAAMMRRHYGAKLAASPLKRRLRVVSWLVCLLIAGFLGGWAAFASGADNPATFTHHLDIWLIGLATLGCLCVGGTILVIHNALQAWREPESWKWARIADTATAVACVVFSLFAMYWHMITFNLNY